MEEINELGPYVVVVTGDLTGDGSQSQFRQAENELKPLKSKNIIYVSGKHGYKATGYLLFKQYFPFSRVTEIDDAVIIVSSSSRPDQDNGKVRHRQNIGLEDSLTKYKDYTKIIGNGYIEFGEIIIHSEIISPQAITKCGSFT